MSELLKDSAFEMPVLSDTAEEDVTLFKSQVTGSLVPESKSLQMTHLPCCPPKAGFSNTKNLDAVFCLQHSVSQRAAELEKDIHLLTKTKSALLFLQAEEE